MTRRDTAAAGESPFLLEALEQEGDFRATLEAPDQESPFRSDEAFDTEAPAFEWEVRMEPASTVDARAAEPVFSEALRKRQLPLLDAAAMKSAVSFNAAQHPTVSEIEIISLCDRLELYTDRQSLLKTMGGTPTLGDITAQMAQQFQRKCFRETRFHTGKLDEPTLDALGFVRHRGRGLNAADKKNTAAAAILRRALTRELAEPLGTDVTAANWFSFMLDAPFLGLTTRGGLGIHLELMRRLRTAQRSLWNWSRYRDLSPVELGDALLWDPADDPTPHGTPWTQPTDPNAKLGDRHRGARPSEPGASMHLAGLAVDLAYRANPWVGSLTFKEVSGRAATLVGGSVTDAAGRRTRAAAAVGELSDAPGLGRRALHTLAQGTRTTSQIYDALAQWNAWLEQYLALGASDTALTAAIAARQADGTPGVVRPGATPARTLADWRRQIAQDLESLRRNSFSAAGTPRDPRKGFLSFHRDLVVALREVACLAWGAVDIGAGASGSGDMMHFDCRVEGIGRAYATATGQSSVPQRHPCIAAASGAHSETTPIFESELKPVKTPAGIKGQLFRLDSKEGGSATGVFVPPAVMTTAPFTVLLWMHGLSRRRKKDAACKDATFAAKPDCFPVICGNADDAFKHLEDTTFSLMKLVEDSGRPVILVVPSMRWSGDSHKLGVPKQMNAFLKEVEKSLEEARAWFEKKGLKGWAANSVIGELILAGHSKAYVVLDSLACRVDDAESSQEALGKLKAVWSLDTMYGQGSCASAKWVAWAAFKPAVKFRVFYIRGTDTGPEGDRLERKATGTGLDKKNLKVIVIPKATGDHCKLPSQQLPSLLAAGEPAALQKKEVEFFQAEEAPPHEQYDTPPRRKAPPTPPPVVDPPGKTVYVNMPVQAAHVKSEVGIFIPDKFKSAAAVDLLVFLRGHLDPCHSPKPNMTQFWNTGLRKPSDSPGHGPVELRETINKSRKNVILVAPSLGELSQGWMLTAKGGFDALIAEVLKTVRGTGTEPTSVRNIVLAAHSGGGARMREIIERKDAEVAKVREVWGFDSMYDTADPAAWLKWAQAEKDPKKRGYFHFFVKACKACGGQTNPWLHNGKLEQSARDASLLGVNVHLADSGSLGHCAMLLPFLEKRLAATTFFDKI